jgi:hypothetical protein
MSALERLNLRGELGLRRAEHRPDQAKSARGDQ